MVPRTNFHARSNSLPSRPHPLVSQFDKQICRLKDSQSTSTSSSSILHNNLIAVQDLHDCVEKLLLLPLTQQELVQEHNRKQVDELLDGSLRVLDLCNTTKDVLLQTKDCVHELQSVIRRRQGGLESEAKKYMSSRKVVKKAIRKALKNLKTIQNKSISSSYIEEHDILNMIKEAEVITVAAFEPLLSFISDPKSQSKPYGWRLVSKLMHHKRVECSNEQEATTSEFAIVDAALDSLIGCKSEKMNVEDAQMKLNSLELCIQDLEDGIECLFRRMIKTRVSFLNIFN